MKGKKNPKKFNKKPPPKILSDKKSELRIREFVEQNFRMLFDKALDGMLLVDIKTKKFLMSNKAICKMLGYSEKEFINLSVSDLHPREQLKYVLKQFSMQAKDKIVLASNIPVLRKDNTIFYTSISASPIQISGKKYLLGIFRDTTERKILTEKLEAEKEIAQRYLDIASVMFVVIGSDQKVKLANKKACQTLGYTENKILGSNWFDNFIPEHIRKKVKETFNKLIAGEIKPTEYFENPVLTRSGKEKIIAWHNTVLHDKKGTITGTLSSGSDITELKKIEESLIHSEEKYRSFFTSVPVGWAYCKLVVDNKNKPGDYIFLEVNNAFEVLTGLKKENILGKKATKVVPQIKKTHWIEKFGNVAITGKPFKGETYLEPFNKWYSLYVSCPQKGYFITVLEDINSRKKFEEALYQSEEKYRIISENIPVVVYSALPDKYSTNIFLSGRAKELTGYTSEELVADPQLWGRIIFDEDKPHVWEAIEKHRAKKIILHVEYRIICKNGSIKWIKDMATPVLDEQGKLIRIDGFMEDITDCKTAEEALRESEDKFKHIFEYSTIGKSLTLLSGKVNTNRSLSALLGYSKEELNKYKWQKITHPDDIELNQKILDSLISGEKDSARFVKRYIHKNGSIIYGDVSTSLRRDKDGKPLYFITCVVDITDRKQAEDAMRAAESRYRELFENIPIGVAVYEVKDNGKDFIFKDFNSAAERIDHDKRERLIGKSIFEVRPGIEQFGLIDAFRRAWKTGITVHHPVTLYKDNLLTGWYENIVYKLPSGEIVAVFENITDRKYAEEALKKSEKFQVSVFNSIQDGVSVLDTEMRIVQVNSAMEKWYAHAMPLVGKKCYEAYHLANKVCAVCPTVETLANKKPSLKIVPKIGTGGKRLGWQELYSFPLMDNATGNMTGVIEYVRDITDRKQAEENLQKSEKQLQIIFETSNAGIIQINPQGKIILANKRMTEILGYSIEKLIGSNYIDCIHPSHKEYANRLLLSLISGRVDNINTERLYIREDGAEFWGHLAARRITESDGRLIGLVVIISDITEHKKLEEELLHSQKMEALGQLAGGVAHDFNNILNAIIGFGSLLKMKMKDDDPLKQHVEQIIGSADRAAELTHNLLAFSRKEPVNFKPVELNEIIAHVEKFLKRIIEENIEFTTKKSKNKLNILADAGHIEQAIINLATNARDAMPDGGQLIISSESIEIDRKYIQFHGYGESGHYAVLSVTDTGIGMSKEIQGKIFDPFFTTKEVNKGTGLGLAMVYGIVKHHKGFINVYSEIGKGTCFKIYLPLTQFEKIEKSAPSAHQSLFGTETVLMAEDDEYLRKLSEAVLGEFGYKVISAKDGEEAVEKFSENKDKIDICIFDIIMPKKSGIKAYEEIKKIKPDVKAFFISGYTSDFISIDKFPEKEFSLLPKPFKPHDLLMKIRETLDK